MPFVAQVQRLNNWAMDIGKGISWYKQKQNVTIQISVCRILRCPLLLYPDSLFLNRFTVCCCCVCARVEITTLNFLLPADFDGTNENATAPLRLLNGLIGSGDHWTSIGHSVGFIMLWYWTILQELCHLWFHQRYLEKTELIFY